MKICDAREKPSVLSIYRTATEADSLFILNGVRLRKGIKDTPTLVHYKKVPGRSVILFPSPASGLEWRNQEAVFVSPIGISVFSFACFASASLGGLWLGHTLPDTQLTDRNRDLIKEARRMLVALATLTLSLIIASATSSFEMRTNEVENSASKIIALDSTLAKYGPKAKASREALRRIVEKGIERIEIAADEGFNTDKTRKGIGINKLQIKLFEMTPESDRETWLRSSALTLSSELGAFRWLKYSGSEGNIQWPFLAILIFWLAGVFVSYGIVAPRNRVAVGTMIVVALAMSMAIHLTLDLDTPNKGLIRMSSAPLRMALVQIGPVE